MGFPVKLFVDKPIDDEFVCSICHDVLKDPVMVDNCKHSFCKSCITDWNAVSNDKNTCPLDGKPIGQLIASSMEFYVNQLELHCQFKKFGCNGIHTVGSIVNHEKSCSFNPQSYASCGARTRNDDKETHQTLEILKAEVHKLTNEVAELKEKYATLLEGKKVEQGPSQSGPSQDGIYGVCIYEHPGTVGGGKYFLDLKLGEIIEIEKESVGEKSYVGIKDGIKGLVGASFVRILPYDQLIASHEVAQCIETTISPMLHVSKLDMIQIICKNVRIPEPEEGMSTIKGWLVNAHGKVGYVDPSYFRIVK